MKDEIPVKMQNIQVLTKDSFYRMMETVGRGRVRFNGDGRLLLEADGWLYMTNEPGYEKHSVRSIVRRKRASAELDEKLKLLRDALEKALPCVKALEGLLRACVEWIDVQQESQRVRRKRSRTTRAKMGQTALLNRIRSHQKESGLKFPMTEQEALNLRGIGKKGLKMMQTLGLVK